MYVYRELYGYGGFQSTLPRGSDFKDNLFVDSQYNFNPRSLAGATAGYSKKTAGVQAFQSTLPRGSDTEPRRRTTMENNFNPRSLAGATFYSGKQWADGDKFQSTLPRGSDPLSDYDIFSTPLISIHAPSRERLYFW